MTAVPFEMRIELGKVREFAHATKATHPAHEGDRPVAPLTFLQTHIFWMPPESDPIDYDGRDLARILHGEQEFRFSGPPPRAGDVLTATARIDREYEKTGKRGGTMKFTESVIEFRDPAGTLVAESRSTIIETAKPTTEG